MALDYIYMYQGDIKPELEFQFWRNGEFIDLTTVTSIDLYAGEEGSSTLIINKKPLTIVDAAKGMAKYVWVDADTSVAPSTYLAEVVITYPDNSTETAGQFTLEIKDSFKE